MNYFEIYNENINNLLSYEQNENLTILDNRVLNAAPVIVKTPEDIFQLIHQGQKRVLIDSTNLNHRSSRSHTILTLSYRQYHLDGSQSQAKLNLVDLAGSERLGRHGESKSKLIDETKKINQSLTSLGRVILALSCNESHIPFRDSKLTHLLKESLGGNSKTAFICTVSRKQEFQDESIMTLKFAQRVKNIKNRSFKNF